MSTEAQLSDTEGFKEWYDEIKEENLHYFDADVGDDESVIIYADTGWHIEGDMDEFFGNLAEFLDGQIKITTVAFEENIFTAGTEWTVQPDGSVEVTTIGQ